MWSLECEIGKLVWKVVIKIVCKVEDVVIVIVDNLDDFLGVKKFCYGLVE